MAERSPLPMSTRVFYEYDALQRMVSVSTDSGRRIDYAYDALGNRLSVTEGRSVAPATTGPPGPTPGREPAPPEGPLPSRCGRCSATIRPEARFCPHCGAPVDS